MNKLDFNKVLEAVILEEKPSVAEVPAAVAEQSNVEVIAGRTPAKRGRKSTALIAERRQAQA
jgi:hypothetical protein